MDEAFEQQLKSIVKPLLKRGRGGDWEHTICTIEYARYMLQHEEGEKEVVIPTLYLHDVGWSKVNFNDFVNASPTQKNGMASVLLHMKYGAELAKGILEKLSFNPELSRKIVSIIEIHDEPEKVFAMRDPSATLIIEADRLDRYGPESLLRFSDMFGPTFLNEEHKRDAIEYLRKGLKLWFKTQTSKALAEKLARDKGLFN